MTQVFMLRCPIAGNRHAATSRAAPIAKGRWTSIPSGGTRAGRRRVHTGQVAAGVVVIAFWRGRAIGL